MSDIFNALSICIWLLCAVAFGCVMFIAKLIADVRLWRDEARDIRDLYRWEKERSEFWRKRLEEEMRRQQDGPYR